LADGRRPLALVVLLFCVLVAAYLANGRALGAGDTLPARYLPWSLLRQATFRLDAFTALYDESARSMPLIEGIPYYLRQRDGHYLSAYSPGAALLALPIYALPVLLGAPPDAAWGARLEKLSAAAITALSALFVFLALRRTASGRWALGITVVYALGTSSLSVSSQGLWQHGPSQLAIALLAWLATGELHRNRTLALAGFAMAGAVALRATNLLLVLPLALWILWRWPRRAQWLALGAIVPAGAIAVYNLHYFATLTGGGGPTTSPLWAFFALTPFVEGLAGLLVSPSRGLFVYSPVLLFSVAGAALVGREGPPALRALAAGAALVFVLTSKWIMWWGGHTWGPRLLADTLPILCILLGPVTRWLERSRALTAAFVLLGAVSVSTHALGAFYYDGRWDVSGRPGSQASALWSWTEGPLVFYADAALRQTGWWPPSSRLASPTSADAPNLLRSTYLVERAPTEAFVGERLPLSVTVTNTGSAVWLAAAPGDRGAVRLGWRWRLGAVDVAQGRALVPHDVAPGKSVQLAADIVAPDPPGEYVLELDLVSELVTWFASQGNAPATLEMIVVRPDLDRLLARGVRPADSSPTVTVATSGGAYRPGDRLLLTVALGNPSRPSPVDVFLLLQGPDGVRSYDGHRLESDGSSGASWRPWVRMLPLPARVHGRFEITVPSLPPGPYAWHVLVTEAGSYRLLAVGRTDLRITP